MGEEEKNVHRLSSTECAQTICTCLHGHALSFLMHTSFCLYHMIIFIHICIYS